MASARNTRARLADLELVPEPLIGEILEGELVTQPRPALPHASVSSILGVLLGGPFELGRDGPGGWVLLFEPELLLGEDVLVPDYAGWRRERMATVPAVARCEIAPDWVCEILSPATASRDRGAKLRIYARERVGHVWLVDPVLRTVEVLGRGEDGKWTIEAVVGSGTHALAPFSECALEVDLLWRALGPPG